LFIPGQTLIAFFGEGFELINGEEKHPDDFGLVVWAVCREYLTCYGVGTSGQRLEHLQMSVVILHCINQFN